LTGDLMTLAVCLNCRTRRANRPRGLCGICYRHPPTREQYPELAPTAEDSPGGNNYTPPLPAGPTRAQPGTETKIRVLEERRARGLQLWHPHDVGTYHGGDE
jgi:hypothetical protein